MGAMIPSPSLPPASPATQCRDIPGCVAVLTSFFHLEHELLRFEAAWLAGVPYWDAKEAIGKHLLEDAQHAEALLKRLHELKASAAEHKRPPGIDRLILEFASAGNADEWLQGLYRVLKPWLRRQFQTYLKTSDPLMDEPSHLAIRRIVEQLDSQIAWFECYTPRYSSWEHPNTGAWLRYTQMLAEQTRVDEKGVTADGASSRPAGRPDFMGISRVRRDRTFRTVTSRDAMPREGRDFSEERFLVFYNHSQEMQFAESLGAILHETGEMPWAYHYDLARHISDEVRHSRMGQARLEQLGYKFEDMPMMTQHYEFRTTLEPLERFCLMTLVMEASTFERKRANVELFEAHADPDSARYEGYDIRDEMLHANLGHAWVPILLRAYHDSRSTSQVVEHCRALIGQIATEYPTAEAANMLRK